MEIRLRRLGRRFRVGAAGWVTALAGVDLEIASGESVAITGPSGSGKSTLLRILGCLDRPSAGEVRIGRWDVGQLDDDGREVLRRKHLGWVSQSPMLMRRATVLENVELPLRPRGIPAAEVRRRALDALDRVDLGRRFRDLPQRLSAGQRHRVAIARSFVHRPRILLADEPTGNVDPQTGQRLLEVFRELNRLGSTVLVVTHDPLVAAAMDRRVELGGGRILSDRRNRRPRPDAANRVGTGSPNPLLD